MQKIGVLECGVAALGSMAVFAYVRLAAAALASLIAAMISGLGSPPLPDPK